MKLLVHELKDGGLSQTIKPDRNEFVKAVRVNLYKHNIPEGSVFVEVRDERGKRIGASELVDISTIPGDYFHGLVTFHISVSLKENTIYQIWLIGTNYSFEESAYVGWCSAYDLKSYPASYEVIDSVTAPLSLEIWTLK